MTETFRALVDLEWYGYLEEGTENYHEVILYSGETFVVTVEKEDEDAELSLTITDEDDNVLSDENATPPVSFEPSEDGLYRFYIKAVKGDSDYSLGISEQD
ncbi:MAG TPA: hypothetical protein PKM21_16060 [Anaerolineales bacterium]|nr:hypothetical protein [Anaerolineales bacterium]